MHKAILFLFLFLATAANSSAEQAADFKFQFQDHQLSFLSLEKAEVLAKNSNGLVVAVKLSELAPDQRKLVMDFTGWGRVWQDDTGKHRTVGDLVEVGEKEITLEKLDGTLRQVKIDRLSPADRKYVEARRSSDKLPATFRAKVIAVTDGDTVKVLLNKRQFKIRISGIDAPELGQAFSSKAKKHLGDMVFGKHVSGVTEETDKYGRNVCTLRIDGNRVDYDLLKNGLAWHYLKYSTDETRTQYENEAKANKLNIWSESGPIPPWDWRRWGPAQKKAWLAEQDKGVLTSPRPPPKTNIVGSTRSSSLGSSGANRNTTVATLTHWLNSSSGVRHNRSCRWYHNTKNGRDCSASEGRGCTKCGG